MFAIQAAIRYSDKNICRFLLLGVIVLATAVISVIAFHINNDKAYNTAGTDAIELICDISVSENDEISIYKLTVAGYLRTGDTYTGRIPPTVSQSFELVTCGTIENIEDIALFMRIDGGAEAVKYAVAYTLLQEIDIDEP